MSGMKPLKVLFFIGAPVPTKEERAEALQIAGQVCFRNAQKITDGAIEKCDAVMGEVPAQYEDCPTLEAALEARAKKIEEAEEKANSKTSKAKKAPAKKAAAKPDEGEGDTEAAKKAADEKGGAWAAKDAK